MSLGSKLPAPRNLSAYTSSGESEADEVTPPCSAPPDAALPLPDAAILPPSGREDAQDSAPASSDCNASTALASESGKKPAWGRTPFNGAIDSGPVVMGASSSWPALSESAKISTKFFSYGSASALGCPANSPPMQRKFAKGGGGGHSSDGVGTSGSFSSDSVPSSSSSIASSAEISQNIEEKQPGKGNYRSWDHRFRESRGWIDQGDRQRKHDGNSRRGIYGNKRDEDCAGHDWSSTRRSSGRDSHMPRGQPRSPVMPPLMPAMGPFIAPPMPVQPFPGPMTFHDFPSQVYYFPTHPHPECFIGFPFVPHPLHSAVQPSMSFAWSDQQRTLLLKQIEYYFSSENLCKDVFLRTNMDEHGWVPIYLIAGFNRVKKLTANIQFILDTVRSSDFIEVEGNKIRKRYGWSDWILNPHKNRYADKSDCQSQATTNQESLVSQLESIGLAEEMSG